VPGRTSADVFEQELRGWRSAASEFWAQLADGSRVVRSGTDVSFARRRTTMVEHDDDRHAHQTRLKFYSSIQRERVQCTICDCLLEPPATACRHQIARLHVAVYIIDQRSFTQLRDAGSRQMIPFMSFAHATCSICNASRNLCCMNKY